MVNKIRSKLFQSFHNRRLHMFGLFLILSFIFLLLTKFSKIYHETVRLQLAYDNLPSDIVIDLETPKEIEIEVEGVGFRLLPYYLKKPILTLDAQEDLKMHGDEYLWTPDLNDEIFNQYFSYSIDKLAIEPDSIIIPFSVLKSKMVPVKVISEIKLSPGYNFGDSLKAVPDSVKVIGGKEALKEVAMVETKPVKKANLSTDISETIELDIKKEAVYKIEPTSVTVKAKIEKFTEGTLEIPVIVKNLPKNIKINYFPKSIPVSFYVQLSKYNEVTVDDFAIECNYDEIKNTQKTFFTPRLIKVPELVKNVRLRQDKVEFILTK
ncbi:CdaR family protein [Aegicerativicinus sediminis]